MNNVDKLVEMAQGLLGHDMTIADGHNNGRGKVRLSGLALHNSGNRREIVALFDNCHFSINPVFYTDETMMLSKWSCGGTFFIKGDMISDAKEYNNSLTFGGGIAAYWTPETGVVEVDPELI